MWYGKYSIPEVISVIYLQAKTLISFLLMINQPTSAISCYQTQLNRIWTKSSENPVKTPILPFVLYRFVGIEDEACL